MDYSRIIIEKQKCFNDIELSGIKNINIIIGKNNIRKSSILDVIEMIYGNKWMEIFGESELLKLASYENICFKEND